MSEQAVDQGNRLRTLECWLPLAEDLNRMLGWRADAVALEQLIQLATPALLQATSVATARAILSLYYVVLHTDMP